MKKITLLLIFLSCRLFAQQNPTVHPLGATPTDLSILKNMTVAIPQSGAVVGLPPSSRMDDECPPVSDQCHIGSCVSQATAYGLCGILAKRQNVQFLFSPMYMHFFIKQSTPQCNNCECMGSSLGLAANFLINRGVPTLDSFYPDQCQLNACFTPPVNSQPIFKLTTVKPLFFAGLQYAPGYKTDVIRYYIANKSPIPIAISLDKSFMDGSAFNNHSDSWQNFVGQPVGGHAMLVVGYDDDRHAFLVMNSWGENWNTIRHPGNTAKNGYCWIDYDIIETRCYEAFVANEFQNGYNVRVADLLQASASVGAASQDQQNQPTGQIQFFAADRYNPYGNFRLIPTYVDKRHQEANIAIYNVINNAPIFVSAFDIKVGETKNLEIDNKKYQFKALYIKPWRRILGIFNGAEALFYQFKQVQ
jgi:hypothetical protein